MALVLSIAVLLLTEVNGVDLGFLNMAVTKTNVLDVLHMKNSLQKHSTNIFFLPHDTLLITIKNTGSALKMLLSWKPCGNMTEII